MTEQHDQAHGDSTSQPQSTATASAVAPTADDLQSRLVQMHKPTYAGTEPPWLVSVDGAEWVVATDGRNLVAVPRETVPDCPTSTPNDKHAALVLGWRSAPALASCAAVVPTLRTFARSVVQDCARCHGTRLIRCAECGGSGKSDCECRCGHCHTAECEQCGGRGREVCFCRPVGEKPASLLGAVISRRRLADALDVVGIYEGGVTVDRFAGGTKSPLPCYRLTGDDWWALVMAQSPDAIPRADFDKPETWTAA